MSQKLPIESREDNDAKADAKNGQFQGTPPATAWWVGLGLRHWHTEVREINSCLQYQHMQAREGYSAKIREYVTLERTRKNQEGNHVAGSVQTSCHSRPPSDCSFTVYVPQNAIVARLNDARREERDELCSKLDLRERGEQCHKYITCTSCLGALLSNSKLETSVVSAASDAEAEAEVK